MAGGCSNALISVVAAMKFDDTTGREGTTLTLGDLMTLTFADLMTLTLGDLMTLTFADLMQ